MTTDSRYSAAPSPEVQYLSTVFRRIRTGDLRMPAFQREFIWSEDQITDLLDSVYRGFPIGSLLFWRVQGPILKIQARGLLPFPTVAEHYPLSFVLDGMQRLSSLYGVFHYGDTDVADIFDMWFELTTEQFHHRSALDSLDTSLRLSDLFKPKELLAAQSHFLLMTDGDALVEKSLKLQTVFQEYMLPLVTIERNDVEEVVSIFETGMKLSSVDFMRAVTWSQEFDLNNKIAAVQAAFEQRGFAFDDETIVKVLAVLLGRDPIPESMLTLRSCTDDELHEGVRRTETALGAVIAFLHKHFFINSSDYVSYEGQIIVLAKLLRSALSPLSKRSIDAARKWFLITGLNETLRGKPDNYIAILVKSIDSSVDDESNLIRIRLSLSSSDLLERRFVKGKALSTAFVVLYALNEPRSIISGIRVEPSEYMSTFAGRNFVPVADRRWRTVDGIELTGLSAKMLSNIILMSDRDLTDAQESDVLTVLKRLCERDSLESSMVLKSHFISDEARAALISNNLLHFKEIRAQTIFKSAEAYASGVGN
jgi:hypothetical protein